MNYFSKLVSIMLVSSCFVCSFILGGCNKKSTDHSVLKVGTIAGPETELMHIVKDVAKKNYGLNIEVVEFTDYNIPNVALNDGSIDANAFQHPPYLDETLKKTNFKLASIGKTIIYPVGAYSKKIKTITELPQKAVVAIPSDPTNQARALLLLEKENLIQLKKTEGSPVTPMDIIKNDKQLVIKSMDAALLTRILPDVDLAIINTTFASIAGLLPQRDALVVEGPDSIYANIIVVREADKDKPEMKQLVQAFQSQEVEAAAEKLFQGQAIPAWK
jgi:YaeC family lipoprotein